jgi:hypothetical protein
MILKSTYASPRPSYQPRCKVCRHPERTQIDLVLATRHPYVRIEREFDLPYRSLSNHHRKHLDFEDPAIKKVVEEVLASHTRVHELGVEVAIERRLLMDLIIQTYYEVLVRAG